MLRCFRGGSPHRRIIQREALTICVCIIPRHQILHGARTLSRSGNLPEVRQDEGKKQFASRAWASTMKNMSTNVRNRGLLLYYWCMAMMDNGALEHYKNFDFFPQASVKLQAFSTENIRFGCSGIVHDGNTSWIPERKTWKPSVTIQGSGSTPLQMCEVDTEELKVSNSGLKHRLYPHPKVVDHVARRILFRGAFVQVVIWSVQGLRGLFSG